MGNHFDDGREIVGKGNHYRKMFYIDRFARHWYCQHARLNQLRSDKREAKRLVRRTIKKELRMRELDGR